MDRLPKPTRQFLHRIKAEHSDVAPSDLIATAFIITLIDSLHASIYATFLSTSYAKELATRLGVDLNVSFTLTGAQWKWRRRGREGGSSPSPVITAHHSINCDFDGKAQHQLSCVGGMVLTEQIGPEEGLRMIAAACSGDNLSQFELCYRNFPGRSFVVSLMACGTSTVCFGGTHIDSVFASLAGMIAGFLHIFCSEGIVGASVSFYAVNAVIVHPNHSCFKAQVLGALFWFFHGTQFIISLFEITSGQFKVGAVRCAFAALDSFRVALGVAVGALAATIVHGQATKELIVRECHEADAQMYGWQWHLPLFFMLAVAILMQLRVGTHDWPMCLFVQTITQGSLYACSAVFGYGDFLSNLVPSFLCTFFTFVILQLLPSRKSSERSSQSTNRMGRAFGQSRISISESRPTNSYMYDYRDAWFSIYPSLYLLVPGSGLVKMSLFSIAGVVGFESEKIPQNFAFIVFLAGMGQVLGVRLGLATFRICRARGWRNNNSLPR